MTPEEVQLIVEFKELNPGLGVKKTVEGLRASIPSITSKMVRSVVMEPRHLDSGASDPDEPFFSEPPPPASASTSASASASDGPRSINDMSPQEAEAYAEKHREKVMKQIEACYKRPALMRQTEMMAISQALGHSPMGKYGLLARGNTVYEFEQMFWVDVVKGDQVIRTLWVAERCKVEATLGHKEAVWMLWKLLKEARNDTAEGIRLIKDEHIARQLEQEFGTNPKDLDSYLSVGAVNPSAMRLAELLGSIQHGIF
ncbi:hypothetical protein DFH06DRAFT_1196987 [Mycena polygramma]|nr:hypothetical protein DFH06DRAFT_1196987 [Mycena polygramma]